MTPTPLHLSTPGLLDYAVLASPKFLGQAGVLLDQLLKEAHESFDELLKIPALARTFEKIVEPFLTKDRTLELTFTFIDSLNGTDGTPQTRTLVETYQPKLVAYSNKTLLNHDFYLVLKKIRRAKKLSTDQKRSLDLILRDMEIAGVGAPLATRRKIDEINKKLSSLSQKFENNAVDDRKEFFYEFANDAALKDMPAQDLEQAKDEARRKKSKAKYIFTLSPPSSQAILKYCSDRVVRELFYRKNNAVATQEKFDNRPLALKILKLRSQKAHLLGFSNYAEYVLQERMAPNTKIIKERLEEIFKPALRKAKAEVKELAKFAHMRDLNEWDVAYYATKLKQQKFAVNDSEVKQYFPLHEVVRGLFEITEKLYGITLKELKVKSYHPDVRTYEVFKDGARIAYFIADFFARPTKRGGAWCNGLRNSTTPIVITMMNFAKASGLPDVARRAKAGSTPSLLTHRDVETLFHEFGHAIHLMVSSKSYANLNGFRTELDFVEFPSQLFENWCWDKKSLALFARHYKTGAVIPSALVQKLQSSQKFMSGYGVVRQSEFAFLDMLLHTTKPPRTVSELDARCFNVANKRSVFGKVKGYAMYAAFGHLFAGGYAAGYYGYMWSEMLEADCFTQFEKAGVLNSKMGRRYMETILAIGARKNGMELFRSFMKRSPRTEAFMKKHDLVS